MQEILHAFGIDWRLIVIQIFNFSVMAGVLWYFLYTPVLKLLTEREAAIKKGIDDAKGAALALEEADAEKTTIIKEARVEAEQIFARTTARALENERVLAEEARAKIAHDIAEAKKHASELKATALKESEAEIVKLSVLTAEKILNTELSK